MLDNAQTVVDGQSPFYTQDSSTPPNSSILAPQVPTGVGSGLDADTVAGLQAVTATVAGPNKLVATTSTGKLPLSIIPTTGGGSGIIGYVIGTYNALKASPPSGISFGFATDVGNAGTLMFYWNNATVGDSGWTILGGS